MQAGDYWTTSKSMNADIYADVSFDVCLRDRDIVHSYRPPVL